MGFGLVTTAIPHPGPVCRQLALLGVPGDEDRPPGNCSTRRPALSPFSGGRAVAARGAPGRPDEACLAVGRVRVPPSPRVMTPAPPTGA